MPTATLTSKGQITVPQSVRRALGLQTGTKVDFVPSGDGFKVVPLHGTTVSLKARFAGRAAGPVSLADMDEAIADEAGARASRRGKR
jgi:AbrB family looped-hinge helix DNA binding protein